MSSKRISRTVGEQWLHSAWETWRDAERDYGVNVGIAYFRSTQPGVFNIQAFALMPPSEGNDPTEVCSSSRVYPSAHTMLLEALIFQLVSNVSRELYYKTENEKEAATM
jgi:hypothetical protein